MRQTTLERARADLRRHGWALVPGAPFLRRGAPDRRAVLRLAGHFGSPSARDGGTAIWPVTPRTADRTSTFSVRAGAAGLHTDAQYHRDPEPIVCLFVVRPAADGGATVLLGADDAVESLAGHPLRRLTLSALAEPRWSWHPPGVFGGSPAPPLPVLPGDGTVRWRADNRTRAAGDAQEPAADVFASCLRRAPGRRFVDHRPGHMIVIDNRRTLHGRTTFTDPRRFLLRVRLWT